MHFAWRLNGLAIAEVRMNENHRDDPTPPSRKRYEKPAFVVVALKPDEAVLGACKTNGASGPGNRGRCRSLGNCSSQGS
jgi:hypothetical protein